MTDAASLPVLITLTHGYATIVDAEDAERVLARKWRAYSSGGGNVYAQTTVIRDGRREFVTLQEFVAGKKDGFRVDHKNRDTLDNRRGNLRHATPTQNNANRKGWSQSGYKGVYQTTERRWRAAIMLGRKNIHLGMFGAPEDAARAYDAAAREAFGEFALLNFRDE